MALKNWQFVDFENFLLACGFQCYLDPSGSSIRTYISPDRNYVVELHYHKRSEIKGPDVAKSIVDNSGIPELYWTKEKKKLKKIKKNKEQFWKSIG